MRYLSLVGKPTHSSFSSLTPPQNVLFSMGSAFLYYVNHFKLYSSFCASHSKAQKVLHPSKFGEHKHAMLHVLVVVPIIICQS